MGVWQFWSGGLWEYPKPTMDNLTDAYSDYVSQYSLEAAIEVLMAFEAAISTVITSPPA